VQTPYELYGPWDVDGYQVEIDCTDGVKLAVSKNGNRLKNVPPAVRQSGDYAWIQVTLDAATQHRRHLKALLENALAEEIPLSSEDLAMLSLDPVGRAMLGSVLVNADGTIGLPVVDLWALETLRGDVVQFTTPVTLIHPIRLHSSRTLEEWDRWLSRRWFKQPFKQIRREIYLPNDGDKATRGYTDRFAGEVVRWDQARALLEGRGWYRVTKAGAERQYHSTRVTGYLEFRTPMSRDFSSEDVVLNRIYFLPTGEQVVNRGNPGMPLEKVPPVVFSETLRDAGLVATVARRDSGWL
jgi:hypothetical protein